MIEGSRAVHMNKGTKLLNGKIKSNDIRNAYK